MVRTQAIVFLHLKGVPVPAGLLEMREDGRWSTATFMYGRKYLEKGLPALDPVQLPLCEDRMETETDFPLFNTLRDSATDAWGRMLIDMHVMRRLSRPATEAEHLLASTSETRFGALCYGESADGGPSDVTGLGLPNVRTDLGDLERIHAMVEDHARGLPVPKSFLEYIQSGSDLGGARPKATVMIDGFPWLAKFSLSSDRIDMVRAEAGCLDLCEMAGLDVPARRVSRLGSGSALLVRRFDRESDPATGRIFRRHAISAMTLLGAHEADRGAFGYADIHDGLRRFGAPGCGASGRGIFMRMAMNVLCGNTDDHFRNHAFILQDRGGYAISPIYDVTPTPQISSSRRLFLHLGKSGSGREATLEGAFAAAPAFGLAHDEALDILHDLRNMVASNWRDVMGRRGLSDRDIQMVAASFSQADRTWPDDPDPTGSDLPSP